VSRKVAIFAIAVGTLSIFAAGCGKQHENLPPPLGVGVPSNVDSVDVTSPQDFDYIVTWWIADDSEVQYYRVYSSFDGVTFSLAADTVWVGTNSSPTIVSPIPVTAFGVSVVSNENAEGAMVKANAP